MTAPLRLVVVGSGAIGRTHARVAAESPDLELVSVVATSMARARSMADEIAATGAPPPRPADSLSASLVDDVDLVAICTPSGRHVEPAREALAAGAHVLIEKPLSASLSSCRSLHSDVRAAAARGQVVSVVSQHRFDPGTTFLRTAVRRGNLGTTTSAIASIAWWRSQSYYDSSPWRGTWELDGGGAVMNQSAHTLDLLLWLLGRPLEISAYTAVLAHHGIEVEDTAVASMSFASGALAVVHATTAAYPGVGTRLQIMGSRGSAIVDNDRLSYFHAAAPEDSVPPLGLVGMGNQLGRLPHDVRDDAEYADPTSSPVGHRRQYADLVAAIRSSREPVVTVDDGLDVVAIAHAIYASARLRRPIRFDDVIAGAYDDLELAPRGW